MPITTFQGAGSGATLQTFPRSPSAPTEKRPALLICPGGAYLRIAEREAAPIAMRFQQLGFQPFVLRYSTGVQFPKPMLQLGAAIATIRQHAELWSIADGFISLCGFSAGGHLAAHYSTFWQSADWAER